jgi:hypothetical protein
VYSASVDAADAMLEGFATLKAASSSHQQQISRLGFQSFFATTPLISQSVWL